MSATEVIEQIKRPSSKEQEEVFSFPATKMVSRRADNPARWQGKKLSFEEACDVVFRENKGLLALLAK
jgi:hypothetical protein